MTNLRDIGCNDCKKVSSGDCGKHGPITMTIGETVNPAQGKIDDLLDLMIHRLPTGGFLVPSGIAPFASSPPIGARSLADTRGWIGWWFETKQAAVSYIDCLIESRKGSPLRIKYL
ncbi:MAG: hypothetical protein L0211_11090 [Planctomycetaceae bacterium]|nr:hypothetical protein [Planctomycetaceae bacterium]